MATPKDFAVAMLNRLGLPVTTNNVVSLVAFIGIEGTWPAGFNPFNSTLSMPGATNRTGIGVKNYKSWADGIEANARTLAQSNMHLIIEALKRSAPPQEFLRALSDSPWCSDPATVQARSPHCNMQAGVLTHCYCDYAAFDAHSLYNQWANKEGGGGGIESGASVVGWIKQHPIITAGALIVAVGGGLYYFRPDLFRQIPVVGQLAAQENPVKALPARRRRTSRRSGSGHGRVQTLLFPRTSFTPATARAWAKSHGFKSGKTDVTDQYVRIRQLPPGGRMRTIQFQNTPVRAVVRFG